MPIKTRTLILFIVLGLLAVLAATGFFQTLYFSLLLMTQDWQRLFHQEVASKLRLIKETHTCAASAGLVFVGFVYGALHALGPGHGKVVVSSYLLASKSSLRRGLIITLLSAMMQAVVAIVLILGLKSIPGMTRGQVQETALSLEVISFSLILVIGLVLVFRGAKVFWRMFWPAEQTEQESKTEMSGKETDGWLTQAGLIASIGIRPCSGALLILIFADLIGAFTAGVFATFAMAFGTALTTGTLAFLTVQSRALALRFSGSTGSHLRSVLAGLSIVGGLFIILLGSAFLQSSRINPMTIGAKERPASTTTHPLMRGFSGGT